MQLVPQSFVHTLRAASTSHLVLDVESGLWMPAPADTGLVRSTNVDEQLEINEIARLAAASLADRLERSPARALREVSYQVSGLVDVPMIGGGEGEMPMSALEIPGAGVGRFKRAQSRVTYTAVPSPMFHLGSFVASGVQGLLEHIPGEIDCYAPIGKDLRIGEPFSDDVTVGLGRDPESGLIVRVLRFDHEATGRGVIRRTMFEVCGGSWKTVDPSWWTQGQHRLGGGVRRLIEGVH